MRPFTRYHPVLGYSFIESARVSVPHERGAYTISTNRDGIRSDRDYGLKKADKSVYRILAFGDSFTAADSVNNNERYTDLLEKRMRNTEVVNFGLSGTGTDQQFLLFKEKGSRYEFDMILLAPLLENIRRNTVEYRIAIDRGSGREVLVPKPAFLFRDGRLHLRNVPVPDKRVKLKHATDEMLAKTEIGRSSHPFFLRQFMEKSAPALKPILIRLFNIKVFEEYYDPKNPAWILMAEIIREFSRAANKRPLVVCPLPYHYQIEGAEGYDEYLKRFSSLDDGKLIRVIDIFKYFKRLTKAQKRQCRWKRDVHYTPFAHRIIADGLHRELAGLKIVPGAHFRG